MTGPYFVGACLFGADRQVADWVAARIPAMVAARRRFAGAAAIGIVRRDRATGHAVLAGGVVFTGHTGTDVEVSGAVVPGFRCSPATLRLVLAYPFGQLGCERLSIATGRKNKAARAFAERLGFRIEGVRRRGLDGRQDAILYGLLREECRFLTKGSSHG